VAGKQLGIAECILSNRVIMHSNCSLVVIATGGGVSLFEFFLLSRGYRQESSQMDVTMMICNDKYISI
jgi:hypothetical protein